MIGADRVDLRRSTSMRLHIETWCSLLDRARPATSKSADVPMHGLHVEVNAEGVSWAYRHLPGRRDLAGPNAAASQLDDATRTACTLLADVGSALSFDGGGEHRVRTADPFAHVALAPQAAWREAEVIAPAFATVPLPGRIAIIGSARCQVCRSAARRGSSGLAICRPQF